jgi:hypothetical protein
MLPADCHGPQANVKVLYQPEGKAARNASTATNWKCLLWERMADPTVASESASVFPAFNPTRGHSPRTVPQDCIPSFSAELNQATNWYELGLSITN